MSCSATGIWISSRSGRLRTTPFFSFGSSSSHWGTCPRPALTLSSMRACNLDVGLSWTASPTFTRNDGTDTLRPFTWKWPCVTIWRPSRREAEAEAMHDVVEPELEQAQEVLAGDALLGLRPLEVLAEPALEHTVDPLGLLLLPELHAEGGRLAAVEPVLARRIVAPLDRALVGEAASALQEELHAFAAAQPALRVSIPRHGRLLHPPPLRRAAPVVRNRRDVTDRGDLQTGGLQRADG